MDELTLLNGDFYTQDPGQPNAQAVAIREGRFVAVGSSAQIRELVPPGGRTIDLEGRRVLPGLSDAHLHLYDWSLGLQRLQLASVRSRAELRQRLAQRAGLTQPGDWILGGGWNETRWPVPRMPTRVDLDAVTPEHPAILWRSDLHLAVANTLALGQAGIASDTPDPADGVIDRDATGQPTGVLRELAINLVRDVIPPPTGREALDAIEHGIGELHRLGLTGIHDYRLMGGADGPPAFGAYQRLSSLGKLDLRLWMQLPGERLDEVLELGLRSGFGDACLRIGHLKLFADGGQGARTAWMLEPYQDTGTCGMPLMPVEELADAVRRAEQAGLAVAVHAIGDRANRQVLDLFERGESSPGAIPHRMEHVQNIRPDDVVRLGRLGIVASVQPIHVTDDIAVIEGSVGERSRFAYPFRDMLDAGVPLALGSDAPVADPNPLWGIHAAVTRQCRDGLPVGGWYPAQRLTIAEAIWGYTMGAAQASGRQAELGSITPGKLADLVVLDRDILTADAMEIAHCQVIMTVFDGRVVFET
ncbi:MAG: amidohydrolase [Anaerolineae bacterium]|jgi:hypothetical protein